MFRTRSRRCRLGRTVLWSFLHTIPHKVLSDLLRVKVTNLGQPISLHSQRRHFRVSCAAFTISAAILASASATWFDVTRMMRMMEALAYLKKDGGDALVPHLS